MKAVVGIGVVDVVDSVDGTDDGSSPEPSSTCSAAGPNENSVLLVMLLDAVVSSWL
jgi:hypothetical protein